MVKSKTIVQLTLKAQFPLSSIPLKKMWKQRPMLSYEAIMKYTF